MILLKIFSGPLTLDSSPFFISIILGFGLFTVSQISWMFCVRNFFDSTFFLTDESIYSNISSRPERLSSISCILLVNLASVFPVYIPKIFISRIHSVLLFPLSGLEKFYLFPSTIWFFLGFKIFIHSLPLFVSLFLAFFMEFIHFPFKDLYHLHIVGFAGVFFLCFSYVGMSRACCALVEAYCQAIIDCVLMLVSRHLGLG